MARNFHRKHTTQPIADLNVTNLIDLGFMLLIIFMVAASVIKQEQKIPIELPVESVSPQPKADPKERTESITVQADGRVLLGDRPFTVRQLAAELTKFAAEAKPPVIHLRFDRKSTAQHFITVMAELKKHNLTRISFDTNVVQ